MVAKKTSTVTPKKKTSSQNGKKAKDDNQKQPPPETPMGSMGPVVPKNPDLQCPHLTFVRMEKLKRKILTPTAWSCSECGTTEGVWACLTCGKIGCGRYQSEHALSHYEEYQHPLALEINLSYCYCYQCEEYVTHDNKKKDLEAIRKLLKKAQTVDTDSTSTTRSGRAIRPPVKIPTNNEFQDEDRLHTAVKHWRLLTLGRAFNSWREFIATEKRQKQLDQLPTSSPSSDMMNVDTSSSQTESSPAPATPSSEPSPHQFVTPPPLPRSMNTSFLTRSTQRALASPSSSSHRIIPGITGLRNLGNTCFMNTVLQALSNTSEFRDFFVHMLGGSHLNGDEVEEIKTTTKAKAKTKTKGKGKEPENGKEEQDEDVVALVLNGKRYTRQPTLQLLDDIRKHVSKLEEVSLAMEVHSLLRVLWSGKWAVVTPCALLESVWKFVPKFRNRQQQDAQEFLCYLFDRLQFELQQANNAMNGITPLPSIAVPPLPSPPSPPAPRSRRQAAAKVSDVKDSKNSKDTKQTKTESQRKRGRSPSPPPASLTPIPLSGDQATIISETFQGKLISMVTCGACNHTSTKLDPFLDLSVDIPVVSIAKPHRKKRKPASKSKAKSKSKSKSKTKSKQPPKSEETTDSETTSSQTNSTSDSSNTTENNDNNNNNNNNNENNETDNADNHSSEETNTTTPTPTSDSDSDHGPLSCTLTDCLDSFIKEETVEGYMCDLCKEKSTATKRLFIHTLPNVLCVVLKRFCWTMTSRAKIDTHVTIPFSLDVTNYMTPIHPIKDENNNNNNNTQNNNTENNSNNTENKESSDKSNTTNESKQKPTTITKTQTTKGQYELRSVVMHHGVGLLSGHYTSFCYNELQDTWVHYNDARVTLVTKEHVEKETPSQAYLMFFQRSFPPPLSSSLSSSVSPSLSLSSSPPASPYNPPPPSPPSSSVSSSSRAKRARWSVREVVLGQSSKNYQIGKKCLG